ncbi:endonuclease VII domain-containing protein [Candidatus Pacearchaeota archaeon]|nr:endonuclease VII domain-containing protein [Candidatus Pacearchaeota archaeon]
MRKWLESNRDRLAEKRRAKSAERNAKRRDEYAGNESLRIKCRSQSAAWQEGNPEKRFAQRLRKYGISPQEYGDILKLQGGGCAICGAEQSKDKCKRSKSKTGTRRLHVDHDHKTGRVRGILCASCNIAIGKFGDDPELLYRASLYLRTRNGAQGSDK